MMGLLGLAILMHLSVVEAVHNDISKRFLLSDVTSGIKDPQTVISLCKCFDDCHLDAFKTYDIDQYRTVWRATNCSVIKRCNVTNPCMNGGNCQDTDNSDHYRCACQSGYTGKICDKGVTWINQPQDQSVTVGSNVTFPCEVQDSSNSLINVWNKGTTPIFINGIRLINVPHRYILIGRNTLFIQNVGLDDDSFYTCSIFTFDSVQVKLAVLLPPGPPSITTNVPSNQFVENSVISFNCSSSGGKPAPTIQWLRNGQLINTAIYSPPEHDRGTASSRIDVTLRRSDDYANYSCKVFNGANQGSPKIETRILNVQYAPFIHFEPNYSHYLIKINSHFNLQCVVDSNPGYSSVEWYKDGVKISDGLPIFRINSVQKGDRGNYTCKASNIIQGKTYGASASVFVEVIFDGHWGAWTSWGKCSVTCGHGKEVRSRTCSNQATASGGKTCVGDNSNVRQCGKPCLVNGNWSKWQEWSSCSKSCASGTRSRTRNCTNPAPANGDRDCSGHKTVTETCNTDRCPEWPRWFYDACSVTCGNGTKMRLRHCSSGKDSDCGIGKAVENVACNEKQCPKWSRWFYDACSVTCGNGTTMRLRHCSSGKDSDCGIGKAVENVACSEKPCPINGDWGPWNAWSTCTATCGEGMHARTRSCDNPSPQNGGADCSARSNEKTACNAHKCPHWLPFTDASPCSVTCGKGFKQMKRTCSTGVQSDCTGSAFTEETCVLKECV